MSVIQWESSEYEKGTWWGYVGDSGVGVIEAIETLDGDRRPGYYHANIYVSVSESMGNVYRAEASVSDTNLETIMTKADELYSKLISLVAVAA